MQVQMWFPGLWQRMIPIRSLILRLWEMQNAAAIQSVMLLLWEMQKLLQFPSWKQTILSSSDHEAAIGKIAGEQIIKLMTLGLTEEEAEAQIVNGFLK